MADNWTGEDGRSLPSHLRLQRTGRLQGQCRLGRGPEMWLKALVVCLGLSHAVEAIDAPTLSGTTDPPVTVKDELSNELPVDPDFKIWALLVAGSSGYSNYRHQADVCHAYQILHGNGIPDENIIVMMYDDIANSEDNPTPGIMINHPGGPNVYEGVPKDYVGNAVTSQNFLNILSGNKRAMEGIGSGKVIESGPNDIVFVNFVDHGGPGILYFPNDELPADRFMKTISSMSSSKKFKKFILYIEACHAGSMFDSLLPDTTNVFVLSASDPFESSYACYYDEERETYLADVFSAAWMNDTEHESLPVESLHHQFERVRTLTNTSHVEEYGDLDIGTTKLKDVLGFKMRLGARYSASRPPPFLDVVDNMDVPLEILERKMKKEQDSEKKTILKLQKHQLIAGRVMVDRIFREIISRVSAGSYYRADELRVSQHGLNWQNYPCYKELYQTFNKVCLSTVKNPYVRIHLQKLINMCSVSWLTTDGLVNVIDNICSDPHLLRNRAHVQ